MPIITYIIIGFTCLLSYQAFNDQGLFHRLLFNPYQINSRKEWYRFFTHGVVHANYLHLIFNMYALYLFGMKVELIFRVVFGQPKGIFFYILLYVGALVLSSFYSFEKHKHDPAYNAVGASGAVSAVVFSSILIDPMGGIGLLFIPFFIPGFIFGLIYLIYSWQMAKRGNDNIGHDAHFWGAVYGVLFTIAIKYEFFGLFILQVRQYFDGILHHS